MGIIDRLDAAYDAVTAADSQLDELAAVNRLAELVAEIRRELVVAALRNHSGPQVGSALGVTRQAINRRYRKQREPGSTPPARRQSPRTLNSRKDHP